jgi:hypothetical protein
MAPDLFWETAVLKRTLRALPRFHTRAITDPSDSLGSPNRWPDVQYGNCCPGVSPQLKIPEKNPSGFHGQFTPQQEAKPLLLRLSVICSSASAQK